VALLGPSFRHPPAGVRWTRRWALALALLGGLALAAGPASAAPEAPEYKVKSVFLFYFTQFVSWPPEAFSDAKTPFVIGILGDDPFGTDLDDAVRGEKANGRPIEVRHFARVEDIDVCHILYVSRSKAADVGHLLSVLDKRSILTVSDIDGFSRAGGIIRFLNEGGKVRLRINVDASRAAGLVISSKLLRPSEVVSSQGD
jgi:hypothetical protein